MKLFETHFEEYINSVNNYNMHSKLDKYFKKFPNNISDLKNLIFYGPNGVGKYSQMLYGIKKYSPSNLKYEKKLNVIYDKEQYLFKISDIHYEIDMSLLGCNSKLLWHEIYQQIVDIIQTKPNKIGIIVCKEFHHIHSELLENFYSYMQKNHLSIEIKFILLTKEISFIPNSIINCCETIFISRPTKTAYKKCLEKNLPQELPLEHITNIKHLRANINELSQPYKIICNKLLKQMNNVNELTFLKFRDIMYDVFIYGLDITDCIWYMLTKLIETNKINATNVTDVLLQTYRFLKYYNNNYRPIYHLESYLLYLTSIIHEYR